MCVHIGLVYLKVRGDLCDQNLYTSFNKWMVVMISWRYLKILHVIEEACVVEKEDKFPFCG